MLKGENTRITPRMIEIFDLISRGLAPKEAAVRLGISPKTVDATMMKCRQRLELHSQASVVRRLIELGHIRVEITRQNQ